MSEGYDENELMLLARERNDAAFEKLAEIYEPLFRYIYREIKTPNDSMNYDEARHIALIGLYKAIFYYREDMDKTFRGFVVLCVSREMKAYRRREMHYGYYGNNRILSSDTLFADSGYSVYGQPLNRPPFTDPEKKAMLNETAREIFEMFDPETTDTGRVLLLKMLGYSYQEIAEKMNISVKKVDNLYQKARRIIKKKESV